MKTDTNKSDADRKAEADADAWFQHRLREYYHTRVDPGGWVQQRPGGARMIGWKSVRPSGSSTISTSRRESGSSYCDERMKGTTRRLRLRS